MKRILAVDYQEDNRRILRDLLTSAGFEVIEATTGEEAVTQAEAHVDRKSTRLNSSHIQKSRMPSSA